MIRRFLSAPPVPSTPVLASSLLAALPILTLAILTLAVLLPLPAPAQAESPVGLWRTEAVGKTGAFLDVRIAPCGDALCGTVEATHNTKRTDLVGQTLMTGMIPDDQGSWGSGTIVAPDNGKNYAGSMWLEGGDLKVRGCVTLLCRSQVWTRVN